MDARRTKGPICGIENCRSRSYEEGEDGYEEQGLVRGADDEDNHMSAARKVTRKQKDEDEGPKKIGKRVSHSQT
jgi:RNA polymerase I-specific transcription initiation factor RRN7